MVGKLFRMSVTAALLVLSFAPGRVAVAQGDEYSEARNLVQRIQDDLHTLHPTGHKDQDRINDVLKHLSDLDRKFTKDKFSKGPLSEAIEKLKDILDH